MVQAMRGMFDDARSVGLIASLREARDRVQGGGESFQPTNGREFGSVRPVAEAMRSGPNDWNGAVGRYHRSSRSVIAGPDLVGRDATGIPCLPGCLKRPRGSVACPLGCRTETMQGTEFCHSRRSLTESSPSERKSTSCVTSARVKTI